MSQGASIASRGRTGKTSSITINTSGKIYLIKGFIDNIIIATTEIMNTISSILTNLNSISELHTNLNSTSELNTTLDVDTKFDLE